MPSRPGKSLLVAKARNNVLSRKSKSLLVAKASAKASNPKGKSASKELSPMQPSGPPPSHLLSVTGAPIPRLPVPKSKTSAQWGLQVKGAHAKLKAMPPPPKLQAIPVAVMPPPEHGHCLLLLLEHGALYVRHVCVRHCAQTGMAIGGWGK